MNWCSRLLLCLHLVSVRPRLCHNKNNLSKNNSLDWNPQGSARMHSGPSLTQFLRESTLWSKMTWLTYKQELRWNCKPSNSMRTLCFSVSFSRSAHAAPGYITGEWDVINMNISAGRQTPVCIPALVDYPRVASVTRGGYWDLNSECIKVLSTTVFFRIDGVSFMLFAVYENSHSFH